MIVDSYTRFIGQSDWEMSDRDDGRTLEGRIVPYEEIAEVVERDSATGELKRYREKFQRHSLITLAQGIQRRGNGSFISLNFDHRTDRDNTIGHCIHMRSEDDGAYATFRLYPDRDIEKIRGMLRESHTGLSVNFGDTVKPKVNGDLVTRVQVTLDHVAATPVPIYAGAGIISMRSYGGDLEMGTPELDRVREMLAGLRR